MLKDERVVQMVQKLAETGSAEDEVIFVSQVNKLSVITDTVRYRSPN